MIVHPHLDGLHRRQIDPNPGHGMSQAGPGPRSKCRSVAWVEDLDFKHRALLVASLLISQGRVEIVLPDTAPVVPLNKRVLADERGECRRPGRIEGDAAPEPRGTAQRQSLPGAL